MARIREVDEAIKPIADILKAKREELIQVIRGALLDGIHIGDSCVEINDNKIADSIIKYMDTQKIARNR